MKLSQRDFKKIQWATLLLIACLLVAGLTVWLAVKQQKTARQENLRHTAAEREIAANLVRARNEEQELRDKIIRFEALKQRGIVGTEQRLDWVEIINQIKKEHRIVKFDYEISPQRKADAALIPDGADAGGLSFMASQMKLTLTLLHEGELLQVLDDLRNQAPAWISLRACQITRQKMSPVAAVQPTANAAIQAECTLEWLTIKPGSST